MRKIFSASPLALCVLGALVLYGCSANGAAGLTGDLPVDSAPAPPVAQTQHANGVIEDWSTRHVIYPQVGNVNAMMALQHDVRAVQSWQLAARNALLRQRVPPRFLPLQSDAHRDWSISLGTGSVAPAMYPAKFSFDTSTTALAAANCELTLASTTPPDFAVFPVDVAASGTQPNIVAFQDLYSGTSGLCNTSRPTYFTGDTVTSAAAFWSYAIKAADGVVSTSPALSLDGTKVAFVELGSGLGNTAHFHVLAWNGGTTTTAGDGVNTANSQDVTTKTKLITSGFSGTAPAANSGAVTDLALGSATDTLSSPFIDYADDLAYVGNDAGVIFRIKNVFCTTAGCAGAAPSLDLSWPTATKTGSLSVCSGVLSGVVVDGATGHIFVGCSDGKLYGFDSTGAALTHSPVSLGDGSATGGIVDPPLVDASNKLVYAAAGESGSSSQVIVQASSVDLSGGSAVATLGAGGHFNLHAPAVNNAYLTGGPGAAGALLYEWGIDTGDSAITLYGIGFTGTTMNSGAPPPATTLVGTGASPVELSPVTEFDNAGTDQLFVSGLVNISPNFIEYNINSFPTTFLPSGAAGATATEGSGTSGIIVDNQSSSAQASSIYFGVIGLNTAVKLTQTGLN